MINIKCILFGHKYSKWKRVRDIGRYQQKLEKKCESCGKVKYYTGIVKTDNDTGEKKPYKIK